MGGTIIHRSPVGWEPKQGSTSPPVTTSETKEAMRRSAENFRLKKQQAADLQAYNELSNYSFAKLRQAKHNRVDDWLYLLERVKPLLPKLRHPHCDQILSVLQRRREELIKVEADEERHMRTERLRAEEVAQRTKFLASKDTLPILINQLLEKYSK